MGDQVMERVAPVPVLPEREPTWLRSDPIGNGRRQAQLGGPHGRSAAEAINGANHGAAAGLIPAFLPASGMTVTVDEPRGRIWVENFTAMKLGGFVPGVDLDANKLEMALDALGGGRTDMGVSKHDSVALGLPLVKARGLTASGVATMRADDVAALLGIDFRMWCAAVAMLDGDLSRASELPPDTVVRGAQSVAGRLGADGPKASVLPNIGAKLEFATGLAGETTLRRLGNSWVAEVSVERNDVGGGGVGFTFGVPLMSLGASAGWSRAQIVTLVAPVSDERACAILSAVLAAASLSNPDPLRDVPGAQALVTHHTDVTEQERSSRVGALMSSFSLDRKSDQSFAHTWGPQGDSVTGRAHSSYGARAGFDNTLTRTLYVDDVELRGGTEAGFAYNANADGTSILLSGGSTGGLYDTVANQTQVRLTPADADPILLAARSEQVWKHLYADTSQQAAWFQLRADLLGAQPDPALEGRNRELAVRVTRLRLVAAYVNSGSGSIEPILNALGRGNLARVGKAAGVLECWPEGSEEAHELYDLLGEWMEVLPGDDWGPEDPYALLARLQQWTGILYGKIDVLRDVPLRARLEMLGQVMAWEDIVDRAWCRVGMPNGTCGDIATHRPTSVARLEQLAAECRSEASPLLFELEPLLCKSAPITEAQAASFDALGSVLAYWKVVAAELRMVYDQVGMARAAWLVRPTQAYGAMEPERDLDPPLRTWQALRATVGLQRPGSTRESTDALQ